jgi:dihydrofolate reductase
MEASAFLATSLDGFIARENGRVDWLAGYEPSDSEDYGFGAFTITRVPVLLGKEIPLFGQKQRDIWTRHVATRSFSNGLVQSEYEIVSGTAR